MKDRFSFESADELIQLLKTAHTALGDQVDKLMALYKCLGNVFKDGGYLKLMGDMNGAYNASRSARQQLGMIIASITRYKEQLYQLYTEDLITQIGFESLSNEPTVRFGSKGEELERKNRQLAFQNEIKARIRDKSVPSHVKEIYAAVGSKCVIASDVHQGTAFYSPASGSIRFNLETDLANPCGTLSTYFHEIGHMIDFQTNSAHRLSDDKTYITALHADCERYLSHTEQRYGCSREDAYYHVSQELMTNNDLYADVSDILGGLTKCRCQNLWGHSLAYWEYEPARVQREAFANMYSVAFGSQERVDAMKKYFPSAYARFEQILEELR